MKSFFEYLLYSLIFFMSCSPKMDSPLEEVFKLAGKNKNELEQVINHYKGDPADSLKLKAAKFLILNMPGKYTESYDAPWEDVATVNMRWSSSSDKSKAYGIMSFVSCTLAGSSIGIFAETAICLESNSFVLEWESGSSEDTSTIPPLIPPSAPQWIASP